jgi:hypothetical protein
MMRDSQRQRAKKKAATHCWGPQPLQVAREHREVVTEDGAGVGLGQLCAAAHGGTPASAVVEHVAEAAFKMFAASAQ